MLPPSIPDLHAALASLVDTTEPALPSDGSQPTAREGAAADQHNLHLYAVTRDGAGQVVVGHVSHSSHSSHLSGSGHNSHASHASHSSHVSGGHSSHVSSSPSPSPSPGPSPSTPSAQAAGKPDLRVGPKPGSLVGNNVYGSERRQTVDQFGPAGSVLSYRLSVQNDSKSTDHIALHGAASAAGYSIQYLNPSGSDVTGQVLSGSFRTPNLAFHDSYELTAVVTITDQATAGHAHVFEVHATSGRTPKHKDVIGLSVERSS